MKRLTDPNWKKLKDVECCPMSCVCNLKNFSEIYCKTCKASLMYKRMAEFEDCVGLMDLYYPPVKCFSEMEGEVQTPVDLPYVIGCVDITVDPPRRFSIYRKSYADAMKTVNALKHSKRARLVSTNFSINE